ncbi:hypothetical protein BsWGS_18160 [Bradybaena similaris]
MVISGIIGVGSLFAASQWEPIHCRVMTCCNSRWITNNMTGLISNLNEKLYGQHLASSKVLELIGSHVKSENPSKALVLSFHGPVGVGKTYVSQTIAKNMYMDGLHSKFVHLISAVRDFPFEGNMPVYKDQLWAWIEGNITECGRSMFIFEEVDKLPAGFLDVLVPFIEYHSNHQRQKYSKTIFILISNTGSSDIIKATSDHRRSGKSRKTLDYSELDNAIKQAINSETEYGLSASQLISRNLITALIPFLPLEAEHVTLCINDFIQGNIQPSNCPRRYFPGKYRPSKCIPSQEFIDEVLKLLTFSPKEEPLFSATGCKQAQQKINEVLG